MCIFFYLGNSEGERREEERTRSSTGIKGATVTQLSKKFMNTDSGGQIGNKEEVLLFKNKQSHVARSFGWDGERREVGRVDRRGTAPSVGQGGSEKEVFGRSELKDWKDNWLE